MITAFIGLVFACGFMRTSPALAATASGDLIRASLPAVYYVGDDGKRYVFPNEKVYFSWYQDFSRVKTVSDTELAALPIGGNVTYRPGTRLVKIQSDPKTYAVAKGGVLRWIATESAARDIFGMSWAQQIDDIPDAFFVNYTTGSSVSSSTDYNKTLEAQNAATINDDKGLTVGAEPIPEQPAQIPATGSAIIIGHSNADLTAIPSSWVASARQVKSVLRHASVGGNIDGGLETIADSNSAYDRTNMVFSDRGNPGWEAKIDDLGTYTAAHAGYDVYSMKFCYIDQDADWATYRDAMLALESKYPAKKFVWWTIPLETTGNSERDTFNASVRAYAKANNKILFDIADIESHTPAGTAQTNGGHEAMYSEYSSDGGHLNATGSKRVASAYWQLMARIAGWNP